MAVIGQRIFSLGGADKFLTLANEEYIRPFSTPWNKIRIGLMCAINPDPSNNTNNLFGCIFAVGLCSAGVGYSSPSTLNWYGWSYGNAGGGSAVTFTYGANTGNPAFSAPASTPLKKTGTTVTGLGTLSQANFFSSTQGAIQRRTVIYYDLDKNAATTTYQVMHFNAAMSADSWSYTMFMDGLEQNFQTAPVLNGTTITANASGALSQAVSEAAGTLNCLSIYWNRALCPMEIYGLGLYRYA